MWSFIVSSLFVALGIGLSYATVLGNVFGGYEVPTSATYLTHPLWLGLPASSVTAVVVFQGFAALGYVTWMWYIVANGLPQRGVLSTMAGLNACNLLFLVPSSVWAFGAYETWRAPESWGWALAACAPLWVAAVGVSLLVGGTFEAQLASPVPIVGILLLSTVVVVADGAGWAALALFRVRENNQA